MEVVGTSRKEQIRSEYFSLFFSLLCCFKRFVLERWYVILQQV